MARDSAGGRTNIAADLLFPLDEVYAALKMPVPVVREIPGSEMPLPYRSLLVHQGDMTPALESFHGARIHLNVLSARETASGYLREVVLLTGGNNGSNGNGHGRECPVEYGAILIHLPLFNPGARREIVEGRRPLGTIMREQKVTHLSRPQAYLAAEADPHVANVLRAPAGATLYGRRNKLFTPDGGLLADIVEILPQESERKNA
jgi:chorismate-pyruvate lyase